MQVTESDAVDVIELAIKHHTSDLTTKAMSLVALLKLSSRFPSCSEYVHAFLSNVLFCITFYFVAFFVCLCPVSLLSCERGYRVLRRCPHSIFVYMYIAEEGFPFWV